MKEIVFTSNSPGEVASWVRVTVAALRTLLPDSRITVALVPCPYASGAELSVVRSLPGVDQAFSPGQTTRFYFGLSRLGWSPARSGLVVFLGGEPWHALLLARRLGYRSLGYFPEPSSWQRYFSASVPAAEVGDLMVDGVAGLAAPQDRPPTLGFFPGSRPWHVKATLGVYLAMAERLKAAHPELEFCLVQSPFVSDAALREALEHPWPLGVPTVRAAVETDRLLTTGGLTVRKLRGAPGETFSQFDVALTIPGTNTAELACAGKPFVVVLHDRAQIGFGGLLGLVERLPLLPLSWKRALRHRRHRRFRFVSIPNLRCGEMVAPEVVIRDSTEPLEKHLLAFLQDSRLARETGTRLMSIMGQPGAAVRFAERIASFV